VTAPFDGIVTNVNAIQVGSYLQASQQAFSLVSASQIWVEASPKETELTYVRPGQPATISVDTYPGVEWKGVVDSISPASGSSFSLLPAQNTTGNWVKVVQRIPMRVRVEGMDGKPPLRVGMSVTVEVDTGHTRGLPDFVTRLLGRDDKPHG
jgi:membrane fusion protein, multidrug efflux system